jgi:mannose-6-phosphate isomerase-like protein (cupin superfamily)
VETRERIAAHLARDEGREIRAPGGLFTRKVAAGETGGAYSLFERSVPPGGGDPPHIQHREDECLYVVEGELDLLLGEELLAARAGSLIFVPRGTLHAFTNRGKMPARVLDLTTPGGTHEVLLEEIGGNASAGDLRRVYARYGIEMVDSPARWADAQVQASDSRA